MNPRHELECAATEPDGDGLDARQSGTQACQSTACASKGEGDKATCPHCGHLRIVSSQPFYVDLSHDTLVIFDDVIALPPRVAEVAACLVARFPDRVEKEDIMAALYGKNGDWPTMKVLDINISKLRTALANTRLSVVTDYGQGWHLKMLHSVPSNLRKTVWTKPRDKVLRKLYPNRDISMQRICMILNCSVERARQQAFRLGLRRRKQSTDD